MYLLIRSRHKNGYREPDVFTFHNVSINSFLILLMILAQINLHSIMYLLIRKCHRGL